MRYPCLVLLIIILCLQEKDSCSQDSSVVRDIDGNLYNVVRIGKQEWLKENLRTTRLRDGTPLQLVESGNDWLGRTGAAYCWYNNDISGEHTYGALYNWYSIASGKLCPAGWHIPDDTELSALEEELGGSDIAASKMKQSGNDTWQTGIEGSTNESGLNLLPGGYRSDDGSFFNRGQYCFLWSTSECLTGIDDYYTRFAWGRYFTYYSSIACRYYFLKKYGFSVRCLRDTVR